MQIIEQATLWETIKSDFQSFFPHDVYRTWFENLELLSEEDDSYMIGVPNDFAAIWIQDNYHDIIVKRLQMATGHSVNVSYKVVQRPSDAESPKENPGLAANNRLTAVNRSAREKASKAPSQDSFLINPKNTFANFVVGSGNQLAHAACVAVANAPARAYNPLFLYGDSGLGKTHLMHAVAHESLKNRQNLKAAYISTEKFTNEFIRAIQENTVTKFRQRYRHVDILLIDDIHFLSGKERIQEEFFHTFNDLFEAQKQIILCSDRPASEIAKLESRLISRFQWGLVSDIQPPDLETRVAILQKKAEAMDLKLPYEIIEFLAERVSRNVRRMEGALTRVAGYAALVKGRMDIGSIENLLKDIFQEEAQNRITIDKIQKKVIEHYHLRPSDMQSKRRPANIAFPRQIAMYLCRTLTHDSLADIGETFGGRDHGTVIHACKAVENMMDQDESIKRNVEYLKSQLTGRS
jgi:chromosomal replication initiator protein